MYQQTCHRLLQNHQLRTLTQKYWNSPIDPSECWSIVHQFSPVLLSNMRHVPCLNIWLQDSATMLSHVVINTVMFLLWPHNDGGAMKAGPGEAVCLLFLMQSVCPSTTTWVPNVVSELLQLLDNTARLHGGSLWWFVTPCLSYGFWCLGLVGDPTSVQHYRCFCVKPEWYDQSMLLTFPAWAQIQTSESGIHWNARVSNSVVLLMEHQNTPQVVYHVCWTS